MRVTAPRAMRAATLPVTAAELDDIAARLRAVLAPYLDRLTDHSRRPTPRVVGVRSAWLSDAAPRYGRIMIVGRVASLYRYPVKAMAAEPVDSVEVSWHGLEGDRRWAFVRSGQARNGFPWFTLRQHPGLHGYRPVFGNPVLVRTPSGDRYEVDDPALADELAVAGPVFAQKINRGTFDSAPLSLITARTADAVGAHVGMPVDPLRFRPNIVVETLSGTAFAEDSWVGATVGVGPVRLHVERRDKRCMVINIDPETGGRDPAVLRGVAQLNEATCGVYGSVLVPGTIAVGDPVELPA